MAFFSKPSGSEWKRHLCFLPSTEDQGEINVVFIKHDNLVDKLKKRIDWEECIKEIFECQSTTMRLKPHRYVLFRTERFWWTIEKDSKGITLQRSTTEADVKDKCKLSSRRGKLFKGRGKDGHKTIGQLIEWLRAGDELNKKYSLLFSNCFGFVKEVTRFVSGR